MATPVPVATSKVELRFQCRKLKDLDVLSKSDPMIVVYHQNPRTQSWDKLGRTELVKNNLNPVFKTGIQMDYFFEDIQNLRFTVLDVDGDDLNAISQHDLIGEVSCTLSKILSQPGQVLEVDVLDKHQKFAGKLRVTAEEIRSTNLSFRFRVGGEHLDKKDLFGKSDPYFIISRRGPSGGWLQVHQSEVIKNTLDPVFQEVTLKMEDICAGNMDAPVKFEFYDWDSIGKHDYIGAFEASVNQLNTRGLKWDLSNEKKRAKKSSYKNSGVIKMFDSEVMREYNFLEYIAGGCEISLVVGIDCTASNGSPSTPSSLHYQHPTQPNQYANAIVSIGNVLAPYDSDNLYPVFGFGGNLPGASGVSHCFPMGLSNERLYARGVDGILDTYYRNISSISLSGPTYFAPLIRETARSFAAIPQSQTDQKYTILLIITDGEILDMDNTIDAIVEASSLPLSIVIVGVGNASFDNMEILDGDGTLLRGSKGRAERDIVQFVPFRQFVNQPYGALASETLREIPLQFMQFMKKYRFKPNPPRVVQQPSMQMAQPPMGQPPVNQQPPMEQPQPPVNQQPPTDSGVPVQLEKLSLNK